jgi:hypothetical protein
MKPEDQFVIVPAVGFERMCKMLEEVHRHFADKPSQQRITNGYMSENEAQKEFNRKTTWFWTQRKNGRLPFKKLGNRIYYQKADLLNLFEAE